jgi:uncharacterized protein (TIGR00251 family)
MALIRVKVHPGSKEERVEKRGDLWEVWVRERPKKGRANEAVAKILRRFFRKVKLVKGEKSRIKLFEVEE